MNNETSSTRPSIEALQGPEQYAATEHELIVPPLESFINSISAATKTDDLHAIGVFIEQRLDPAAQKALAVRLAMDFTDGIQQHFAATMIKRDIVRFSPLELEGGTYDYALSRMGFYGARRGDDELLDKISAQVATGLGGLFADGKVDQSRERGGNLSRDLNLAKAHLQLTHDFERAEEGTSVDVEVFDRIKAFNESVVGSFNEQLNVGRLKADVVRAYVDVNMTLAEKLPEGDMTFSDETAPDVTVKDNAFTAHKFVSEIEQFHYMRTSWSPYSTTSAETAQILETSLQHAARVICTLYPLDAADAHLQGEFGYNSYQQLASLGNVKAMEYMYDNVPETGRDGIVARNVAEALIRAKLVNGMSESRFGKELKRALKKGLILEEHANRLEMAHNRQKLRAVSAHERP